MNNLPRLMIFFVLAFAVLVSYNYVLERAGLIPKPPVKTAKTAKSTKTDPQNVGKNPADVSSVPPKDTPAETQAVASQPTATPATAARTESAKLVDPALLVLGGPAGSDLGKDPFRIRIGIDQRGGAVSWIESTAIEDERVRGKKPERLPLLRRPQSGDPSSFTLGFARPDAEGGSPDLNHAVVDSRLWEVEPNAQGGMVHELAKIEGKAGPGQEIRLRSQVDDNLSVTRRYRLWPGEDVFTMSLEFQATGQDQTFAYRMLGPHGIPIEGDWYTSTFRDVVVGLANDRDSVEITTKTADEVAKNKAYPYRLSDKPIRIAGVEDQYFAVFVMTPSSEDARKWLAEAQSAVVSEKGQDRQRADVTIDLLSKKLTVGPNRSETHEFTVFAGSKTTEALPPMAVDLATYRKGMWVLGSMAAFVSKWLITPLLGQIYRATAAVGRLFGGTSGNWGIAIILLTCTVRLGMFPISRKQAISAKRMQDLQPHMNELREKYKDDKERMTKETFALYGKHKVNPFGGCLPALLQLPIFIGLWQALNNSVYLRHASFLWIENLAAPDMMFKFPFDMNSVPLIGGFLGPYFNLLPLIVAGLMLVSTKLFSPPAATPEAEQQQAMMKYMMIFMVFMFYKVPAGLGIYFITSSLWQICERLLLPKVLPGTKPVALDAAGVGTVVAPGGKTPAETDTPGNGNTKGWLAQKLDKLLEEASKDPTVRNRMEALDESRRQDGGRGPDAGGDGKSRSRPGGKKR